MKNLVNDFDVRGGGTHVAAIVFGDKAQVVFDFNELRGKDLTRQNVVQKINDIPQLSGLTRIDLALLMADTDMFSFNGGIRRNSPQVKI